MRAALFMVFVAVIAIGLAGAAPNRRCPDRQDRARVYLGGAHLC